VATRIYHYNTHAEKRYFLGPQHHGLYDMIALNGNIVSNTPEGVAGFLATAGKDFYIDPQTHAFQHPTIHLKRDISDKEAGEPQQYEFKPSIVKLATERLKGPFADVVQNDKPIRPTVFLDGSDNIRNDVVDVVCEHVMSFQLNAMLAELDDEAKELIGDMSRLQPNFLIAPYFCLATHPWREWFKINVACYKRTRELFKDLPIYFGLVLSRDRLNDRAEIIEALSLVKPNGILLWIDEHVEEMLGGSEIDSYVNFLQGLKQVAGTRYNSHGGYLSILLCHSEVGGLLDGVGHAMNYGEHRAVVPIGGGLPMAQFYLLSVHSRLRYADAASIIQPKGWLNSVEQYRENICRCHQCQELLKEKGGAEAAFAEYGKSNPVTITRRPGTIVRLEYPTKEAKQAATRHYLYNKAKEFENIEEKNFRELLIELNNTYNAISSDGGEDFVRHLFTWHEALGGLMPH